MSDCVSYRGNVAFLRLHENQEKGREFRALMRTKLCMSFSFVGSAKFHFGIFCHPVIFAIIAMGLFSSLFQA